MDDAVEFLSAPATMILLNDVVEHVPADVAFLRTIVSSRLFKAGTRLLITVPAFQSLWTRHDAFLGHYRRYTRELLRSRLQEAGLTTATEGYFFLTLLPIRAAQAMLERAGMHAKEEKGIGQWGGGHAVAGLFRKLLLLDFRVGRLLSRTGVDLPGLSCYAICTPRYSTLRLNRDMLKKKKVRISRTFNIKEKTMADKKHALVLQHFHENPPGRVGCGECRRLWQKVVAGPAYGVVCRGFCGELW